MRLMPPMVDLVDLVDEVCSCPLCECGHRMCLHVEFAGGRMGYCCEAACECVVYCEGDGEDGDDGND